MVVFFLYTGLEMTLSQWAFTVLTEGRGVSPGPAGSVVGLYWGSIGAGRVVFGLVADRVGIEAVEVRPDGLATPVGTERGWRRSLYVLQRRKELPTLLESFDFPQMTPNCIERVHTTVASQALNLMNDTWVRQLAGAFARRVASDVRILDKGRLVVSGGIAELTDELVQKHLTV